EPALYVVRDGIASRVPVQLGYADGGWIEVRDGVGAGDSVVVAGKSALREGSAVQVIGDDAPVPAAASADAGKGDATQAGNCWFRTISRRPAALSRWRYPPGVSRSC